LGSKKIFLERKRKEGGREGGKEGRKEGRKQGKQQIRKLQIRHAAKAMRNSRSSQTPVSLLRIARFMRNLETTVFVSKMLTFA
jgi:ribosomal protein L18E